MSVSPCSVLLDSSFMLDPSNPMNAAAMAAANCPTAPSVGATAAATVTPVSGPGDPLFELVKRRRLDIGATGLEAPTAATVGLHGVLPSPSFAPPFAPSLAAVGAYGFDNGLPAALTAAVDRPRLLGATPAPVTATPSVAVSGPVVVSSAAAAAAAVAAAGGAGGGAGAGAGAGAGGGEDVGLLRKKYDELRRVNADLMAANDLLLEQVSDGIFFNVTS